MSVRSPIHSFTLANPLYKNASISFYTVAAGVKTTTLATLYSGTSGTAQLANPQKLNSKGQFKQPVYIADQVIGVISGISVPGHDTAIISPSPTFRVQQSTAKFQYTYDSGVTWNDTGDTIFKDRGAWVTATDYNRNDLATNGGVVYYSVTAHTSGVFATDLAAGKWVAAITLNAGSIPFSSSAIYTAGSVGQWLKDLISSAGAALVGWIQSGTGAVLRLVQDKLRDTIDIRDFGAVCDAASATGATVTGTDDTVVVQAAVTAAVAQGKTLIHSRGKSRITSTITMPDGLRFKCTGGSFYYDGAGYAFANGVVNVRGGVNDIDLNVLLFRADNKGVHLLNQTRGIIRLDVQGYIPDGYSAAQFAARTNVGLVNETNGADHGWNIYPRLNLNHIHTGIQDIGNAPWTINNNDYGIVYYFGDQSYGDTGSVGYQASNSDMVKIAGGSIEYYGAAGIQLQGACDGWRGGPLWFETSGTGGVGIIFEADATNNHFEVTNNIFTPGTGGAATGYWNKGNTTNTVSHGYYKEDSNRRVKNAIDVLAGMHLGAAPQQLAGVSNSLRNSGATTAATWAEHFVRTAGLTNAGGAAVILTGEFAGNGTARVFVSGNETGGITHSFFDTLICSFGSVGNANFVEVKTNTGSDSAGTATRTYSVVGNTLKLLVSGGTYSVNVHAMEANQPIA